MKSWKRYLAAFLLNAAFVMAVLLIKGFELRIYYVDAFGVAGSVSILLGLLMWIAAAGAFDTIGYGFSYLFSNGKYKDLYEYTVRKKEKRSGAWKSSLPYVVTGAVFLIVSFLIPVG